MSSSGTSSSANAGGRLFVITGPSGVGKGTLIARLLEQVPELELSVSATTREPRESERDGVHYHFIDDGEFERRIAAGEFIEHAGYASHRYGTPRAEVDPRLAEGRSVVLEIELQGARQIRETVPDAVQVFIAPPSPEDLRRRLEGRGTDSPEQITNRLAVAAQELAARDEFGHVIENDDVDRASRELAELVRSHLNDR
ncbi:MAG TPA: guanylate kinase [Solirubrobacterales bacterium]|nr:guanylate kinase [Solirubrobacterales bacterium]